MTGKGLQFRILLSAMFMVNVWWKVEGKRARVKKKGKNGKSDMTFAIAFVIGVFCLTFIPLIGYFLYNVWKDPLTPSLVKNGTEMLKEKTMGFLSKKKRGEVEDKEE
jgi:hypothetical protein